MESYHRLPTCTCHYQCQCLAMRNAKDFQLEDQVLQFLTGRNVQFSIVHTQSFANGTFTMP